MHDANLEHSLMNEKKIDVHMFFFSFLCSGGIPDLALGILKTLIRVCFRDVLQPAVYQFVPVMIWLSVSLTVFTVNLSYLQALAIYKKVLSKTKSIMNKSIFLYSWFPLTDNII